VYQPATLHNQSFATRDTVTGLPIVKTLTITRILPSVPDWAPRERSSANNHGIPICGRTKILEFETSGKW